MVRSKQLRSHLALRQVIGHPGLHGFQVNFVVAASGQHNDRKVAVDPGELPDDVQAAVGAQVIIDQDGVDLGIFEAGQGGF
jgi:hypothetical protein